jgi:LysR family transcriptional regulator, nod-box dependent transcriptional activator
VHFKGLDLNLLIALDALLAERNVTRAAERIHISQPGMSAALQKLRWYFKDELLERIGRRLEPTPRARELMDAVRQILDQVKALGEPEKAFDPRKEKRIFRLGCSTFCSEIIALPLALRLAAVAPGISVQFNDILPDTLTRLLDGGIDVTVTVGQRLTLDPALVDRPLRDRPLFSDYMVLVAARRNRALEGTLDYDQLCKLPYVETRFGGDLDSMPEQTLRQQNRRPKTQLWLPNFQQALAVVAASDMVTIAPSLLARRYADTLNLRILDVPFHIPVLEERLFWHPRHDGDLGHCWFRDVLTEVVAASVGQPELLETAA